MAVHVLDMSVWDERRHPQRRLVTDRPEEAFPRVVRPEPHLVWPCAGDAVKH